jgi:predicted nucleotidyltransferase
LLSKKQAEILNLFRKSIFLKVSILGIAKLLKEKSYQRVYESTKALVKKDMLKSEKMGNTDQISFSWTDAAIANISFLDEEEAREKKLPHHDEILSIKEIRQHLILITGSYARQDAKKSSDLDLVIIIPDGKKAIELQKLIENKTLTEHPLIHSYVFNNKDFIEMLTSKEQNYGKEIVKNHLLLKNAYIYYDILKEAAFNELNSKTLP